MDKRILTSLNVKIFPCHANKRPSNTNGFHGATTDLNTYDWPSDLFGIDIPKNVVIIDLDKYKGVTRQIVEYVLGGPLDWEAAFIQFTPSGGEHYAFRVPDGVEIKQGDSLLDTPGFDIRLSGKGYICSGTTYKQADALGVAKLAHPESLPPLPQSAIGALSTKPTTDEPAKPLPVTTDVEEVKKMLTHLDPACSRKEWMDVLCGLRHYFHAQPEVGYSLFDTWSRGCPEKYSERETLYQWKDIKPVNEGGSTITLGTLRLRAIHNGYVPSSVAAEIFGDAGTPGINVDTLVSQIEEEAANPDCLEKLTQLISVSACSNMQREALKATLKRALKTAGLQIPAKKIDDACNPPQLVNTVAQPLAPLHYFRELQIQSIPAMGNNHLDNAVLLVNNVFNDRLKRFSDNIYWWCGSHWELINPILLRSKIPGSFLGTPYSKTSNMDNTSKELQNLIYTDQNLNPPRDLVYFKNGVFDPYQPGVGIRPHIKENYNNNTLAVDYNPQALPPVEWLKFIKNVFDGDDRTLLLQEMMGVWFCTGNLGHHKAHALTGVSRAGKGIIMEIGSRILNGSARDMTLDKLSDPKSLSSLREAMIFMDRDAKTPSKDVRTTQSFFNQITANEPVSVPLLYSQTPWNGRLNITVAIACNGIPNFNDDSGASPNRWVPCVFTKSFAGKEDLTLLDRLLPELPQIAMWAMQGLIRLAVNGRYTMPPSSVAELQVIQESASTISQFANDRLTLDADAKVHMSDIYNTYKFWCKENGFSPYNINSFRKAILSVLQSKNVIYKKSIRVGNAVKTGLEGVQLAPVAVAVG